MTKCKCIICRKEMMEVCQTEGFYPYDGLEFVTYGHYGSTVFDSIGSQSKLHVVICDDCIKNAIKENIVKGDLNSASI